MDQLSSDHLFWLVTGSLFLVVSGGFGAYVSEVKHRYWAEGFIFGVVMGPLGVIAEACLPTLPAPVAPKAPAMLVPRLDRRAKEEEAAPGVDVEALTEKLRKLPLSPFEQRIATHSRSPEKGQ